jgi:hypothetical protein
MLVKVAPELPVYEVQMRAVRKVENAPWLPKLDGVRVEDIPDVFPVSLLRHSLIEGAKQFRSDLRKRGYEPVDTPILAYGPYPGRNWAMALSNDMTVWDRYDEAQGKDYLIIAKFRKMAVLTEIWTPQEE